MVSYKIVLIITNAIVKRCWIFFWIFLWNQSWQKKILPSAAVVLFNVTYLVIKNVVGQIYHSLLFLGALKLMSHAPEKKVPKAKNNNGDKSPAYFIFLIDSLILNQNGILVQSKEIIIPITCVMTKDHCKQTCSIFGPPGQSYEEEIVLRIIWWKSLGWAYQNIWPVNIISGY